MFDYFFKRRGTPPAATASPSTSVARKAGSKPATKAASDAVTKAATSAAAKASILAEQKAAALQQARALEGDEAAAAAFILQCEFADARLLAAQQLHSEPLLVQLLTPMRQTDRRVARLLQQRLEALAQQQRTAQQVAAWLAAAQQLLVLPHLLPNQVAELDRDWQAIGTVSASQLADYQPVRAALEARLLAQIALQRAALDTLARWRQLQDTLSAADPLPATAEIARALAILENAMNNHLSAPEAASLPRHFHSDFEQQQTAFAACWQQAQQRATALEARRQLLAAWQAAPEALLAPDLQRAWQAAPALAPDAAAAELEQQFQTLLSACSAPPIPEKPQAKARTSTPASGRQSAQAPAAQQLAPPAAPERARQQAQSILPELETALEQGALQDALDCDARLRALGEPALRWPAAPAARLAAARAELARLQGWARWGGNLSRAELLSTAQELPSQALAPSELGKQVGALRARWKALDASAGAAPKDLWLQFDAACSLAYAPAAEHFSRQAEQRRAHLLEAEALLTQIASYAARLTPAAESAAELTPETAADAAPEASSEIPNAAADQTEVDWKEAALFCARMQQAWRRLGSVERKEQKRLQRAFDAALQAIAQPLAQQQAAEAALRGELIAAVRALDPAARDLPNALRALQQRWQERAQALPLERRHEQRLWKEFRAACDAVFAQRKQESASAEQERRRHLQQKEALCQALEAALLPGAGVTPATVRQLIAQHQSAWAQIGAVPRALEDRLHQRRAAALAALHSALERWRHGALDSAFGALQGKLALCQELERQLLDAAAAVASQDQEHEQMRMQIQARWAALAPLAAPFESVLRARLEAAVTAVASADRAYAALLETNQAPLQQAILQLEILCAVDSPPQLARQRLQMQVEVLAAKLKSGDAASALPAHLLALCGLPARCEPDAAVRISRLLEQCARLRLAGIAAPNEAAVSPAKTTAYGV